VYGPLNYDEPARRFDYNRTRFFKPRRYQLSRKSPRRKPPGKSTGKNPARLWESAIAAYQRGDARGVQRAVTPLLDHPAADGNTYLLAGLAEAQLARFDKAERLLQKAVALAPGNADAWLALGNARHALGHVREAVHAYREAADNAPGVAQAWNNLAVAHEDMGQVRDALDYYDRTLAIDPNFPPALRGRAGALARLRWFEQANDAYRDLIKRFPNDLEIKLDFARLLELANRPEEAMEYLPDPGTCGDKALDAQCEYLRAQVLTRRGDLDTALASLRAARRRTGRNYLSYREGLILDRLGRYDEAMEAFLRANAARAGEIDYKRLLSQPLTEYLAEKLETGVRSGDPAPDAGPSPVVVTGLPRSGTTLLDRMLAAHPDVQVLEELEGLHTAEHALADGAARDEARRVYWDFIGRHVDLREDAVVVDKNPMHVMHLDVLPVLFPASPTVLVLRHPFDAALSCFMQDFDPGPVTARFLDLESTAQVCAQFLRLMRAFEAARPEATTRLRYEHLITDFRSEVARILDFMGLDWSEEIESYAAKAAQSAPIMTASYEQVTRKLYHSSVERWRHYEKWLEPFKQPLGEMLGEFGYSA